MIRFLLSFAINVVLAAVGLLVAANVFDGVTVHASGFTVAVLVFAVAQGVLAPFVFNVARKYASAVLGGIGLVSRSSRCGSRRSWATAWRSPAPPRGSG